MDSLTVHLAGPPSQTSAVGGCLPFFGGRLRRFFASFDMGDMGDGHGRRKPASQNKMKKKSPMAARVTGEAGRR